MNLVDLIKKLNTPSNTEGTIQFSADFSIAKNYIYKAKNNKKDEDKETWIVEGYASTSDLDSQNSIITEKAIEEGAASLQKYTTLLYNHDMDRPIGKILLAEAKAGGKLFVKCSISKSEKDIWQKIQDGTLSKFSIMGEILDADEEEIEGKSILVIKSMRLFEVSLVSVPANPEAKTLNWYIEKALIAKFNIINKEHNAEDYAETEDSEKPDVDSEILLSALDEVIQIMDTVTSGLVGNDRNQSIRVVQWMQAIKEKYDPQNQNSVDTEKSMGDLIVIEKDYVAVLDGSQVNEKDPIETEERENLLTKNLNVKEDLEENKLETKVVDEVSNDENINDFSKSMVGIVTDLKDLAKLVVDSVNESKKYLDEINSVKNSMSASLEEVKDLIKSIPIRKTSIPNVDEDARKEETSKDVVTQLRNSVKNYDALPPQEKLRHYLKFQQTN